MIMGLPSRQTQIFDISNVIHQFFSAKNTFSFKKNKASVKKRALKRKREH